MAEWIQNFYLDLNILLGHLDVETFRVTVATEEGKHLEAKWLSKDALFHKVDRYRLMLARKLQLEIE